MILIIDDEDDISAVLVRLLRGAGYEAVASSGGAEGLKLMHVHRPELVVLDIGMPRMDGLAVLDAIKHDVDLMDVRVAMHSSDTRHEVKAAAMQLGAVDFLVKGTLGLDKLVARICELANEAA